MTDRTEELLDAWERQHPTDQQPGYLEDMGRRRQARPDMAADRSRQRPAEPSYPGGLRAGADMFGSRVHDGLDRLAGTDLDRAPARDAVDLARREALERFIDSGQVDGHPVDLDREPT